MIRYEGGHNRPRAKTLERIAAVGGVTVDWLLRGEHRPVTQERRASEWGEAVAALRVVWREPSHRPTILTLLRTLARGPSSQQVRGR